MRKHNAVNSAEFAKVQTKLNILYDKIPATKGCMEHITKAKNEGGCGGWCCKYQNPQVLYSEFLNTWKATLRDREVEQVVDLIEKAIRNYLSSSYSKGCIYWDSNSLMCTTHETRPYNCRLYGITPKEEFQPRYERLKVLAKQNIGTIVKDQCPLVSTVDGSVVTKDQTDKWWQELVKIEESMGIRPEDINDDMGGTYRTYHDHLLIHVLPEEMLESLTTIRLNGGKQEKEDAVENVMSYIRMTVQKTADALRKVKESDSQGA